MPQLMATTLAIASAAFCGAICEVLLPNTALAGAISGIAGAAALAADISVFHPALKVREMEDA